MDTCGWAHIENVTPRGHVFDDYYMRFGKLIKGKTTMCNSTYKNMRTELIA